MRTLDYGEEQWLLLQLSTAMHKLGIEVTPETVAHEKERLTRVLRSASATNEPPDPYARDLAKLRGDRPTPKPAEPPTGFAPPDPYAKAIEDLKRSEQR